MGLSGFCWEHFEDFCFDSTLNKVLQEEKLSFFLLPFKEQSLD